MSLTQQVKTRAVRGFAVAADSIVCCPHKGCAATEGAPCHKVRGEQLPPGAVHLGRRLRRLLLTAKANPEERAAFERDAVSMLLAHLRDKRKRECAP